PRPRAIAADRRKARQVAERTRDGPPVAQPFPRRETLFEQRLRSRMVAFIQRGRRQGVPAHDASPRVGALVVDRQAVLDQLAGCPVVALLARQDAGGTQRPPTAPVTAASPPSASTRQYAAWPRRTSSPSPDASSCSMAYSRIVSSIAKRASSAVPPLSRSRLWLISDPTPSSTSSPRSRRASQTASAASSVQPPANTAKRRNKVCSWDESRS